MNVNLAKIDTMPPKGTQEEEVRQETKKLHEKMIELHNLMYAQDKYSLLIVLQ